MHPAFGVDSYPTSRPIFATNVNSPNDIDRLFDTITYQKVCEANIFFLHSTTYCYSNVAQQYCVV